MNSSFNLSEHRKFSQSQLFSLLLLFIAGLLLRWLSLDARPVHHDESLHLMYGRYFFDWPDQQFYKYSAMLHGPFLYNALRAAYDTFGSSTWAGRALTALLGSVVMFSPLLFRRHFSNWGLIGLCAAFALSPSLIYWSRFIREDTFQILFMCLTVVGAVYCRGAAKAYVVALGVILQFCEKENSYVSLALLLGFMIFEALFSVYKNQSDKFLQYKDSLLARTFSYIKEFPLHTFISVLIAALIYCYFYTAGFRYQEGILDGIYRESLAYWFNQHAIQRIPGPFLFHFYTLNWYESVFVGLTFLNLIAFYRRAGWLWTSIAVGVLFIAAILTAYEISRYKETPVAFELMKPWALFHLKRPIEILGLFIVLIQPVICTTVHLLRGEKALAFSGYFFWASAFTYSYLGEKVPWLSVYILVPGIVYLSLYFDRCVAQTTLNSLKQTSLAGFLRWSGVIVCLIGLIFVYQNNEVETWAGNNALTLMAGVTMILIAYLDSWLKLYGQFNLLNLIVAICLIYTIRHAYMTNFTHAGSEVEYFSQVHTSKRFHNFILDVRKQAETPTRTGVKPLILAEGDSVWPVTWYLVDIPQYKFSATPEERKNFDYIFEDHKAGKEVPNGFCAEVLPLRSWYVPDFDVMTFKNYLVYMFNRRPWGGTGSSNVTALVKTPEWQSCPRIVGAN